MSTAQSVAAGTVHESLRGKRVDVVGYVFAGVLLFSLLFTLAVLAVLVGDQLQRGLPVLAERGTDFLTSPLFNRVGASVSNYEGCITDADGLFPHRLQTPARPACCDRHLIVAPVAIRSAKIGPIISCCVGRRGFGCSSCWNLTVSCGSADDCWLCDARG